MILSVEEWKEFQKKWDECDIEEKFVFPKIEDMSEKEIYNYYLWKTQCFYY